MSGSFYLEEKMFVGAINEDVRGLLSEISRSWQDLPIYVGCSGNFTVERVLSRNGVKRLHGNDVSLYSSAVGNYLTGREFEIGIKDERYEWLSRYMKDAESRIALLLVCSEYFKFVDKEQIFYKRTARGYESQFEKLHEQTVLNVKRALDGLRLEEYTCGDVVEYMMSAPEESVAISFPPTYKGGYEKLYAKLNSVFEWAAPEYEIFDAERRQKFNEALQNKKYWVTLDDKPNAELQEKLIGRFQSSGRSHAVYVYGNVETPKRITKPHQKLESVNIPRGTGELHGDLRLIRLTSGQLNTLRSEYLSKKIVPASADVSIGVMAGKELIGACGISRSTYLGGIADAYMMSDFSVSPSKYKRLSKLVLAAALSTEMKEILEAEMRQEVNTIATTAFTERASSMKYRGLFDVYNKKEGVINYLARAGRWTLKEGYDWWQSNHGQK